jgi:hypothetical protein
MRIIKKLQVKKTDGTARHCNKCEQAKPPRAHHCTIPCAHAGASKFSTNSATALELFVALDGHTASYNLCCDVRLGRITLQLPLYGGCDDHAALAGASLWTSSRISVKSSASHVQVGCVESVSFGWIITALG